MDAKLPDMTLHDYYVGQAITGLCANAPLIDLMCRMHQKPLGEIIALKAHEVATFSIQLKKQNEEH